MKNPSSPIFDRSNNGCDYLCYIPVIADVPRTVMAVGVWRSAPGSHNPLWGSWGRWCTSSRWIAPHTFCPFPDPPCTAVIIFFFSEKKRDKRGALVYITSLARQSSSITGTRTCLTKRKRTEIGVGGGGIHSLFFLSFFSAEVENNEGPLPSFSFCLKGHFYFWLVHSSHRKGCAGRHLKSQSLMRLQILIFSRVSYSELIWWEFRLDTPH